MHISLNRAEAMTVKQEYATFTMAKVSLSNDAPLSTDWTCFTPRRQAGKTCGALGSETLHSILKAGHRSLFGLPRSNSLNAQPRDHFRQEEQWCKRHG